jgi:hypothetical protein
MNACLDEQIRQAGVELGKTSDPVRAAALSARMVALAQVRARVWRLAGKDQ